MKKRLRNALACFLVSFFAYFRYLLVAAAVLIIGSFLFHPLLYAGILALVIDFILSVSMTLEVAIVFQTTNEEFTF
ncbi:MAG: hypothetical protein J6Y08_08165 [Clostridiales bacterium]|nr:hypothetical protein [Clostridiales bacterium]